MKRILAIVLLCLMLVACAQQPATTQPPVTTLQPTVAPTQAPTTVPTEPTTVPPTTTEPIVVGCGGHESDPYENVDKTAFYENYTTACCYTDACYRTAHFLMSGSLEVPGQYAQIADYQPTDSTGMLLRNTDSFYEDDGNTYIVVDGYGNVVMRIFKGAAYITLEEVAAYMYAFGGSNDTLPANYSSKKVTKVGTSPWGIYLRGNHSNFSGDTSKYPYEPVLPNISGCGGDLRYYELDIGTTGTDTGNGYAVRVYNDGTTITRGAARIVYARVDLNKNGVYETNEVYVFYTCNHYNDFQEYLNYYGGWGRIFGNETGGGTLSSKYDCNPTPYEETGYASFSELAH